MTSVKYFVNGSEYSLGFQLAPDNCSMLAEECAADYHYRVGWEHSWPITIAVQIEDGDIVEWEVEREAVPSFNARRK